MFGIKAKNGFTLLELILVIVVLAVGLTGTLVAFTQGTQDSSYSQNTGIATTLAQDLMEEVRSKCWDESATPPPCNPALIVPGALGPNGGEARAIYDDIDDYHGINNSPPLDSQNAVIPDPYNNMVLNSFRQQVSVCYVPAANLDDLTQCATTSNYKRVSVTVSWGSPPIDQVELVQVFTNH
jgi:MSHA pilin protein MshD